MLWSAPAGARIDLNPAGFDTTWGDATDGAHQVGGGFGNTTAYNFHAFIWSGTAASVVDINPSGFLSSLAVAISGSQQVGYASNAPNGTFEPSHAFLWSGTAASAIDLNPPGYSYSRAFGTDGTNQVGQAGGHAILWAGTAASAIDLNPTKLPGFTSSQANGVSGPQQVGWGYTAPADVDHALVWSGTAASAVDLQLLLPATGTWTDSTADSIDPLGNIFGAADGTLNGVTGTFAVEWSAAAVPEPGTLAIFTVAAGGLMMRRKRA
jgi:hypothetical protein